MQRLDGIVAIALLTRSNTVVVTGMLLGNAVRPAFVHLYTLAETIDNSENTIDTVFIIAGISDLHMLYLRCIPYKRKVEM